MGMIAHYYSDAEIGKTLFVWEEEDLVERASDEGTWQFHLHASSPKTWRGPRSAGSASGELVFKSYNCYNIKIHKKQY